MDFKKHLKFYLVAFFAVFLGSQITEGVLLVPYWQSLSPVEFYKYYNNFGPAIGKFYTILTIIAVLIPITLTAYYFKKKASGLKSAIISSVFAILFLACFYIYFKGANDLFYDGSMNKVDLKNELITWKKWHWSRIVLEFIALFFLIDALVKKK